MYYQEVVMTICKINKRYNEKLKEQSLQLSYIFDEDKQTANLPSIT